MGHLDYESRADLGDSSRLRAALFASVMQDAFSDPLHQIVPVATATRDVTESLGATVTAEKALVAWARLTGVVEARGERYSPYNERDITMPAGYPARRSLATVGAELRVHVAPIDLDVFPSARLEASSDVRTGRDIFGAQRAPDAPRDRVLPVLRLGLLRPLGRMASLRGNVGRYHRIPSFLELYGYNRGVLGNPTLRPERGVNADLGVTVSRPAGEASGVEVTASLTAFGAQVEDLIAWRTFSYQTHAENVTRARIWGLESELRARRGRMTLIAQATLTDARDQGDIASNRNRQIPHHPRTRAYTRAEWRQPVSGAGVVLQGYADVDATAGNSSASVYAPIPPRLFVGAGVAIEHPRSGVRVVASGFNLTDSRVNDFPGYPLPGRSVFVSLGWSKTAAPSPLPSPSPQSDSHPQE